MRERDRERVTERVREMKTKGRTERDREREKHTEREKVTAQEECHREEKKLRLVDGRGEREIDRKREERGVEKMKLTPILRIPRVSFPCPGPAS